MTLGVCFGGLELRVKSWCWGFEAVVEEEEEEYFWRNRTSFCLS